MSPNNLEGRITNKHCRYKCSVKGCIAKKSKYVSFHRLPRNEITKRKWLDALGRENVDLRQKYTHICSDHFDESFINRTLTVARLKDDAIPRPISNTPNESPKHRAQQKDGGHSKSTSEEWPRIVTTSSQDRTGSHIKKYKICRVCMSGNATEPSQSKIGNSFINITGIKKYQVSLKEDLAIALCETCWAEFYICLNFVENAQKANYALCQMKSDGKLNLTNIKEAAARFRKHEVMISGAGANLGVSGVKAEPRDDEENDDEATFEDQDIKSEGINQTNEEITIYYTKSEEEISDTDQGDTSTTHTDNEQALVTHLLQKINKTSAQTNIKTIKVIDKQIKKENTDNKQEKPNTEEKNYNCNLKVENIDELKMDIEINETELIESEDLSDRAKCSDLDTPEQIVDKTIDKEKMEVTNKVYKRRRITRNPADTFEHKDVITIQRLSLDEQKTEVENRQYSINFINSPFKCNDCFKGFLNEMSFERHRERHSDLWGEFECEICKYRFPSAAFGSKHMARHRTSYKCKLCDFAVIDRNQANNHALEHKGQTSYQCQHCGIQFAKSGTYMSHLRIKHVTKFACEFCGFSYLSEKGLEIHKSFRHRSEKENNIVADGPACASCNIKFVSDEALNTHTRVAHPKTSEAILRNELSYNTWPPFNCEMCGEVMKNNRSYRAHFLRVHSAKEINEDFPKAQRLLSKAFMCEQCGQVFASKISLQKHTRVHTNPQPNQCQKCGKVCSSEAILELHNMSLHRNQPQPKYEGPEGKKVLYPCSICKKSFANFNNRARHMVIHTGLRPFKCEICSSSFKTPGEVKSHTRHVHMKVPWPKKNSRSKVKSTN